MMQEWTASVANAEQLSVEVLCVHELAEEAKKLRERKSVLGTVARAKVSTGGKLMAMKSKRKDIDIEAKVQQTRVGIEVENARVEDFVGCTAELEKQLEQSSLQKCIAESKYSLLFDEAQMLEQTLATGVYCNGVMKQRLNS